MKKIQTQEKEMKAIRNFFNLIGSFYTWEVEWKKGNSNEIFTFNECSLYINEDVNEQKKNLKMSTSTLVEAPAWSCRIWTSI